MAFTDMRPDPRAWQTPADKKIEFMEIASRANERRKEEQKPTGGRWLAVTGRRRSRIYDHRPFPASRFQTSCKFLDTRARQRSLFYSSREKSRIQQEDCLIVCRQLIHEWNYREKKGGKRERERERETCREKTRVEETKREKREGRR